MKKASEGPESRRLFVNREELIVEFLRRVHEPAHSDILYFYGEGGIGKSSLLDQLEDIYSFRLDDSEPKVISPWSLLANSPAREIPLRFARLPSHALKKARINFAEAPNDEDPREMLTGLQVIQRRLDIAAPLFRSGCVLYLHQTKNLTKEWMKRQFPGEAADYAVGIVDQPWTPAALAGALHAIANGLHYSLAGFSLPAVGLAALCRAIWGVNALHRGPSAAEKAARRKLGSAIEELALFKPHELLKELPRLLAEDINAASEVEPERIVLFFDGYDLFAAAEGPDAAGKYPRDDAWFRRFLGHLRPAEGIIVVVTGRCAPSWEPKISRLGCSLDCLSQQDAETFLRRADIASPALREAFLRLAAIAPERIQPFFLALLVDAYRLESERNVVMEPEQLNAYETVQEKQRAIIDRLIAADPELREAILALSACRSFDWNCFNWMGAKRGFVATLPKFRILTTLSCVRPFGDNAFSVHALMRRFLGGNNASDVIHKALLEYYLGPGNSVPDLIYHQYFLDPISAAALWLRCFQSASARDEHAMCSALISVRRELPESFALEFSRDVGAYLTRLGRFDDAESEFSRAASSARPTLLPLDPFDRLIVEGLFWTDWGQLRGNMADLPGAEGCFRTAEAQYQEVLSQKPGSVSARSNLANVYAQHAELLVLYGSLNDAESRLNLALAEFTTLLANSVDDPGIPTNYANALSALAGIRQLQGDRPAAEALYQSAERLYASRILESPDVGTATNYSVSNTNHAALAEEGQDYESARWHWRQSIAACDSILAGSPTMIEALRNKSIALQAWALMEIRLGYTKDGSQLLAGSATAANAVLQQVPNRDCYRLFCKALAILGPSLDQKRGCGMLNEAARLLKEWVVCFPEDSVTASAIGSQIDQGQRHLNCATCN